MVMEDHVHMNEHTQVRMANLRTTADRFINTLQVKTMQKPYIATALYKKPLGEVDATNSQSKFTFPKFAKNTENLESIKTSQLRNKKYFGIENENVELNTKYSPSEKFTENVSEVFSNAEENLTCEEESSDQKEHFTSDAADHTEINEQRNFTIACRDDHFEKMENTGGGIMEMSQEPSHHARRPMNAFLIFCKRHRAVVRERYPSLENRAVTKILGEWWACLDEEDKECYTALAKQYKDAFFNANPDFKWYKLPAPPLRSLSTRPGNAIRAIHLPHDSDVLVADTKTCTNVGHCSGFTPGKLADETQLGNLCSLIDPNFNLLPSKQTSPTYLLSTVHSEVVNADVSSSSQVTNSDANIKCSDKPTRIVAPNQNLPYNESSNILPKPPKKRFTNNIYKQDLNTNYTTLSPPNTSNVSNQFAIESSFGTNASNYDILMPNNTPFVNLRNHALYSTKTIHDRQMKRLHKIKRISVESADSDDTEFDLTASQNESFLSEHHSNTSSSNINNINNNNNNNEKNTANKTGNMTQQELIDRIVDHSMCSNEFQSQNQKTVSKQQDDAAHNRRECYTSGSGRSSNGTVRKSGRTCKGKRYAEFMTEGRLVVNKRGRKSNPLICRTYQSKKSKHKQHIIDKSPYNNIKPLEQLEKERNCKESIDNSQLLIKQQHNRFIPETQSHTITEFVVDNEIESQNNIFRKRTISDASDDSVTKKMFRAADFNLDEKIEALPSLSLEKFQQRKKENKKKRKIVHISKQIGENFYQRKTKTVTAINNNNNNDDCLNPFETNNNSLTGSRKRKARKESITHLEPAAAASSEQADQATDLDLFNLATLAEVAVKLGGCP